MSPRRLAALEFGKPRKEYTKMESKPIIKCVKGRGSGVLAQVSYKQDITLLEAGAETPKTLTTVIKVREHDQYRSVTEFNAEFYIKDVVAASQRVGSLHAQTIARTDPMISKPLFVTELLGADNVSPKCHATDDDDADETQTIMRHLFYPNASPRFEYHNRTLLFVEDLHFIVTFQIFDEFHGRGLAQLAMESYHEAVQKLRGGFAFKGPVVLSPAALRETFAAKAGYGKPTKSYVEIEHALIASYRKSGYKVWSKADDALEGCGITIMGRTIGARPRNMQDTAPEEKFPPFVKADDHAPARNDQGIAPIEKQESPVEKQESPLEERAQSTGDVRRGLAVVIPPQSRKRKAPEEALDDSDRRPVKRVDSGLLDSEWSMECGGERCELCGVTGRARWHKADCEVWTTCSKN
ncbi:uncharacterized protein RCC_04226 [Ramularia collo-cygni]|uniref:Uncharacterized protein n=1 Tax=Ramularia collo-cygni TaxID=112498 RepID=A0A2D3UPG1_9PEZI|nr:uncharacterized protein RCC_04226 [Ramularia collo-cygni]CZT18382.1 uncharacterized protein RCC_04226 [Ramularia collo-cygni]